MIEPLDDAIYTPILRGFDERLQTLTIESPKAVRFFALPPELLADGDGLKPRPGDGKSKLWTPG